MIVLCYLHKSLVINSMKSKIHFSVALSLLMLLVACKVKPKPIGYGNDHCHYCDMTVVDKTHAAQYVTKKGKAYSFDAIECMIWALNENNNEDNMAFVLVADFDKPGELINARKANYLVSQQLKSPMGAGLSAFISHQKVSDAQKQYEGKIYTWKEIKIKLKK